MSPDAKLLAVARGEQPMVASAPGDIRLPTPFEGRWRITCAAADAILSPDQLGDDTLWRDAKVPGTALAALHGAVSHAGMPPLHDRDVWYQTEFMACAGHVLRFHGLAGLAEIWLGNDLVAVSSSMFLPLTVTLMAGGPTCLSLRFRALSGAMAATSGRSRWRTRLVTTNALRWFRQTLLGHMPGWCPSFHAVGPYRAVELVGGPGTLESCRLSTALDGDNGILSVELVFHSPEDVPAWLMLRVGQHSVLLDRPHAGRIVARLTLPAVERWWPHTHGTPVLHEVVLSSGRSELTLGRVGFREVAVRRGEDGLGFAVEINGVGVFCRGACWASADLLGLRGDREAYEPWLQAVRDAGMNMVRIGGTMLYESRAFHALCDELGILVWQDLMFANLDYPLDHEPLRHQAIAEVEHLLERLAGSPSFIVLCGGSEMAQQATMLGLHASRRSMPFFESVLPDLVRRLAPDLHYVPHSPWGGPLPITVGAGVSHYYGVGAFRRPLDDARRAGVRFASECLAFANPPSPASPSSQSTGLVPRDPGVSWDFADIRDHYLAVLYVADPVRLRIEDSDRYLELSRAVTADLMEAVFSEWRRPGSTCSGGLVWQLQDVAPGSGWGVIDSSGYKKAAWHGLRRVLAPVQLLLSDEGMDGLALHVLNETSRPLDAVLTLDCLRRGSVPVVSAKRPVALGPRASATFSSQDLLDGFFDISRAFHFGAPEHHVTVATLRCAVTDQVLSEAFHFPLGRALPLDDVGLKASVVSVDGVWFIDIAATRFAQAVHIVAEGFQADEDWFHLPPAVSRRVRLRACAGCGLPPSGVVRAINSLCAVSFRAPAQVTQVGQVLREVSA